MEPTASMCDGASGQPQNPLGWWRTVIVDGATFYRIPVRGEESRRARGGGGRKAGFDAPVLLLNGCALAAGGWLPVIDGLPGREIIAVDRPGFAGTRWNGRLPDLAAEAAVVQQAILRSRPIGPVIIVAHSMASFRAEALARLRPEFVAGIVLVDPSIETYSDHGVVSRFFPVSWLHHLSRIMSETAIRELGASLLHWGFLRQIGPGRELDRDVFKDPYAEPETIKSAFAEWLSYRGQAAALTALRASTPPVRIPTSAIFATEDPSAVQLRTLRRGFADLALAEEVDSGHLMMIDRPEVIVRAVAEIALRAVGVSGPRP